MKQGGVRRVPVATTLPEFPWDTLTEARRTAERHPDGIVDLSVGTPVDPVHSMIQHALTEVADQPGYPQTIGTRELRHAMSEALTRRFGTIPLNPDTDILPAIGTKELIAGLPSQLGLSSHHLVAIPEVAYPTYEVGARLAGAHCRRIEALTQLGPETPALIFVNSPSNPTGRVLPVEHLRKMVEWARERGAIIASDECYLGLSWEGKAPSILDPEVCGGDTSNLLAIHSLSKTSNMASYRTGFLAGDADLIAELLAVRKHTGFMMPTVIQHASAVALADDAHEAEQYERYAARRARLLRAMRLVGLQVDHSEAGLYLWVTAETPFRELADWFAQLGILVAPGEFYGPAGSEHVRVAFTASDERIEAACQRLQQAA